MFRNIFSNNPANIDQVLLNSLNEVTIKKLKIKKSRCAYFLPNKNADNCGCGLPRKDHDKRLIESYSKKISEIPVKWSPLTCTIEDLDTDAYGEIQFENQETTSKFIRVGQNTDMQKMIKLLFSIWNLEPPKLLISVTGGAQNFNLKSKLKDVFRRGLVKAALSTNAWITSGGNNVGVMKYVGEAISVSSLDPNKKLIVLGISNWCTVTNRHLLIKKTDDENEILHYNNMAQKGYKSKSTPLDPNHSHFILVDNSELNVYGGEVEFRAKLEREIVNYVESKNAPIVVLVLEGGERTILTVLNSVKNGSPCVFIEGSGGCADFFAFTLNKMNENGLQELNEDLRNELEYRSGVLWPTKSSYEIVRSLENVLQYSKLLSVFRLDSSKKRNEVDVAILRSLLKAQSDSSIAQLKLALTWNRIDIAKDFIFTEDKDWKNGVLNDLMYSALVGDKPDFVEIFLENDCDINEFLTYRRLLKLYNDLSKTCLLYKKLIKKKRLKHKINDNLALTFKFKEIGEIIEDMTDDLYSHSFTNEPLSLIDSQQAKEILAETDDFGNPKYIGNQTVSDPQSFHIDNKCKNPYHEIFMYSILTGKSEIAKIFWNYSNEITSALVASKIFKEYDNLVAGEDESYTELSEEYEKMAVDVIQSCYEEDQEDAQLMLLRQVPEYGNANAVLIGSSFENKNFVSSSCFQLLLAKLWHGQIFADASLINIIFAIILPFFAPLFLNLNFDKYKLNLEAMNIQAENAIKSDELGTSKENESNEEEKQSKLSYWEKIYYFFRSPFVKFCFNQIFFIIFLGLFSYVILCNFYPIKHINEDGIEIGQNISWAEYLLIAWVLVFILDEIRQLIYIRLYREITTRKFFTDIWNIVELGSILLFTIGTVLRFFPNLNMYLAARIILSIDILFWFFRSLQGYSVIRSLGPKLVMIRRMLNELAVFILIVIVFIFAYGVATQALMYHNQELSLSLLKNVFFGAYFVIGGEYFEREKLMEVNECEGNSSELSITDMYTQDDCPEKYGTNVSLGLLVVYIIMLNILLVNLLIAIFSNAYEKVESEADKIWKFQRYRLVNEYFHRPFLPVPFTVLYYLFEIFRMIFRFIFGLCFNLQSRNRISLWSTLLLPSESNRLKLWESFIAEEYLNKKDILTKESQEYRLQINTEKVDTLNSKFEKMTDSQSNLANRMKNLEQKMDKILSLLGHNQDDDNVKNPVKQLTSRFSSADKVKPIEYYSDSNVEIVHVPYEKKEWTVRYDNYFPNQYTSTDVLYSLSADFDLLKKPENLRPKIKFNRFDNESGLDRTSCLGEYIVRNGIPLNPHGRQGISGRGSLYFWGPNQFYEIIFTRYKTNNRGEYSFDTNGKSVIEFLALDNKRSKLRFPSVLQEKNVTLEELIERNLIYELFSIEKMDHMSILTILKNPINITRYYKESKFNTDNAWFEFCVINYHDQADKIFPLLKLKDSFDGRKLSWKEINEVSLSNLSTQDSVNLKRVLKLHQIPIEKF